MALIIETGGGVANANSYGVTDNTATLAAVRSYTADRGVDLSIVGGTTDAQVTAWLVLGTDYLESFADRFVGSVVSVTQALSFPRQNIAYSDGTTFPSNILPVELLFALYQLVIEQKNGIKLQPSTDYSQGGFIIEEKVDVLMTKYSEKVGTGSQPSLTKVNALLKGLLRPVPALRVIRV